LFFNVPARRKFLKSDATESFHITNLVQHYALANPAIAFLLVNNGRDALTVESVRTLKERAYQVLGDSLLSKLVAVDRSSGGLTVTGFVSNPQEQRSSRDAQYLFVNGRFVRDQLIGRGLTEAYRSMMPSGTYPAAVLFIETPHSEVDVNVHPAKTEVRFLHSSVVLAFIRDAVAEALTATRPIAPLPGFNINRDDRAEFGSGVAGARREVFPDESRSAIPRSTSSSEGRAEAALPPSPRAGSELARLREELLGSGFAQSNTEEASGSDASSASSSEASSTSSSEASSASRGESARSFGDSNQRQTVEAEAALPGLGHGIK